MQKALIIKLSLIAGICLIFVVGLTMISSLIYERQSYSEQVIQEIAEQHVNPQQVITPFITVPSVVTPVCNDTLTDIKSPCKSSYTVLDTLFASQTTATQNLDVSTDTYQRGIYNAISYQGDLLFDQTYQIKPLENQIQSASTTADSSPSKDAKAAVTKTPRWQDAKLIIPVSDLRGITTLPTVTFDDIKVKASYPTPTESMQQLYGMSYVEVSLPDTVIKKLADIHNLAKNNNGQQQAAINQSSQLTSLQQTKQPTDTSKKTPQHTFTSKITLPLSGISTLNTVPTGNNFELAMTSNWHAPNFIGKALPNTKNFTNTGFDANWQNQYLTLANNQLLRQCLSETDADCFANSDTTANVAFDQLDYQKQRSFIAGFDTSQVSAPIAFQGPSDLSNFGVSFAEPNDVYLQTERTMKYALLLILVSFGTFFLFEIIKSSRIHPIQYLLVGSALLVFYVLLLPLAEQIAFFMAYVIAASACVGLIGWYSYYLLGSVKRAALFTAILGGLYAAFYGILTVADLNLLLGAVFCFVLLASVMVMTRKIDWYKVA